MAEVNRAISSLTEVELKNILDILERDAKPRVQLLHDNCRNGGLAGTDAWYQMSYPVFTTGEQKGFPHLIRAIAYAYSWLATIPTAHPTVEDFRKFSSAVRQVGTVTKSESTNAERAALVRITQGVLDLSGIDSVVAVSKVLHFWDPTLAPMIDKYSRVALGNLRIDPKASYVEYWKFADRLIAYSKKTRHSLGRLTYRRLDELLFQLGRGVQVRKTSGGVGRRSKSGGKGAAKPSGEIGGKVTKIERARQLIIAKHGNDPKTIIRDLVNEVGLTPQGASTYYYKLIAERRASAK